MPTRSRVDRLGDWSIETTRRLLANPALTIAGVTVVLFVVARVPTQIFYSHFGVKPDEVGFDSVQILLQGTSTALFLSVVIGLAYGVLMPFLLFVAPTKRRMLGVRSRNAVWALYKEGAYKAVRVAPIFVPVFSLLAAAAILTIGAFVDASAIKDGRPPSTGFMPWKAVPVEVIGVGEKSEIPLPDCRSLFYLGEEGGQITLYNSVTGDTYRIESGEAVLAFPSSCRLTA